MELACEFSSLFVFLPNMLVSFEMFDFLVFELQK
jgi:hypothetical protein